MGQLYLKKKTKIYGSPARIGTIKWKAESKTICIYKRPELFYLAFLTTPQTQIETVRSCCWIAEVLEWPMANLQLYSIFYEIHSKSERSVWALKTGPFRWVKYSPIFGSNLAPLDQGQYSPISHDWFGPSAEIVPTVGWNSLLIELFWPKFCSNGSRKGWISLQGWIDTLRLKQILLIFSVASYLAWSTHLAVVSKHPNP